MMMMMKIVENDGCRPDQGKVMAIQNLKPAKTTSATVTVKTV